MLSNKLIKIVSDIDNLIEDLKTRLVDEKEFKEKLRGYAQDIMIDATVEENEILNKLEEEKYNEERKEKMLVL